VLTPATLTGVFHKAITLPSRQQAPYLYGRITRSLAATSPLSSASQPLAQKQREISE